MLRIRRHKWGNYLFDAWVIGFTVIAFWGLHKANNAAKDARHAATRAASTAKTSKGLTTENQKRINEIQAARVASCKRTYEGIREVFKPFTTNPKDPNVIKFNNRIDQLKANCPIQTHVKKKPDGGG